MEITGSPRISIRMATPADRLAVSRLAELDSAPVPLGPVLVADLDDEIVAAYVLAAARSIADPFRPTADARQLLELRATQLPPETTHPRRRYLPRSLLRRRGMASALAA